MRFRVPIPEHCPKDEHGKNFVVELECPDGGVVRVLIPADSKCYEAAISRAVDNFSQPIGLNLVCPGHYT